MSEVSRYAWTAAKRLESDCQLAPFRKSEAARIIQDAMDWVEADKPPTVPIVKKFIEDFRNEWYLVPIELRKQFDDDQWEVVRNESDFLEDGDESTGKEFSDALRIFRERYDQYKFKCDLNLYEFGPIEATLPPEIIAELEPISVPVADNGGPS